MSFGVLCIGEGMDEVERKSLVKSLVGTHAHEQVTAFSISCVFTMYYYLQTFVLMFRSVFGERGGDCCAGG